MIKLEDVYKIGLFNKPHGIHGELHFSFTDDIFDRVDCDYLICSIDDILVPFFIEEYRFHGEFSALVKLEDVDTEEQARLFTNREVFFPKKWQEKNSNNDVSWDYFKGFRIEDEEGNEIGVISHVDDTTINALFSVQRNGKEFLIPAREEYILGIDHQAKVITLDPPEGLLQLGEKE